MNTLEKVRSLQPLQMLPGPSTQGTMSCQGPIRKLGKVSSSKGCKQAMAPEKLGKALKSSLGKLPGSLEKLPGSMEKLPAISYACMPAAWAAVW